MTNYKCIRGHIPKWGPLRSRDMILMAKTILTVDSRYSLQPSMCRSYFRLKTISENRAWPVVFCKHDQLQNMHWITAWGSNYCVRTWKIIFQVDYKFYTIDGIEEHNQFTHTAAWHIARYRLHLMLIFMAPVNNGIFRCIFLTHSVMQ